MDYFDNPGPEVVVRDFGFFLPSGFLSVLTNIIFSNSDFLSGIAK